MGDSAARLKGTYGGSVHVQVIYAAPDAVWRCNVMLPLRSCVKDALIASGFFQDYPDYNPDTVTVGIYGQICGLQREVVNGDRVEIYRPLIFDPMESRRRRALHRQRIRKQKH